MIGLLAPWAVTVDLRGEDVTGRKPHTIVGRGVGYVAQRDNVFPTMSVEENLELGALPLRSADPASRMTAMLDLFPRLAARRSQPAGTLSGGERQMLALARALMADRELLLLDEPSAGLSPVAVDLIFEKIAEINATGVAILMVEQNAAGRWPCPIAAMCWTAGRTASTARLSCSTTRRSSTSISAARARSPQTSITDPGRRAACPRVPRAGGSGQRRGAEPADELDEMPRSSTS